MLATNVKLSAAEMALACDSEVLLTKNRIIAKVYELFGELAANYQSEPVKQQLPADVLAVSPKISRGENYMGLPWVMLDYPRHFKADNFFSIRTFFWWGNYFTMAMLVKGIFLGLVNMENLIKVTENQFFISTVSDPWQHHISKENTLPLKQIGVKSIADLIKETGFLKVQVKIEITDWDNVQAFMEKSFKELIGILNK